MANNGRVFKHGLFLTVWILSICFLIQFSANNELNTRYYQTESQDFDLTLPKNQIGTLSYIRRDPKENGRPIYSIHFNKLLAENNHLGIFKTGLHKVVKIRGLGLRLYQYGPTETKPAARPNHNKSPTIVRANSGKSDRTKMANIPIVLEDIGTDVQALIKFVDNLIKPQSGWLINIDLSNVSEVLVNDFDYQVFCDGDLFLAIESKRAIASYKHSALVLRGHVTITAADGGTLECNHAEWYTKKEQFKIDGIYVLNRNGVKTTGKNICVDTQLNLAGAQHTKSKQWETQKCFAKLQ